MTTLPNVQIVDGAKGPRDLTMLGTTEDVSRYVSAPKEGEVVFRSRFKKFMLLLKPEVRKVVGDEIYTEPAKYATFESYEYRTTDPWEIDKIRAGRNFGLGRDFWDHTEAIAVAQEAQYQQFVRMLDDNPRLKERLAIEAGLKDFRLPVKPIQTTKQTA